MNEYLSIEIRPVARGWIGQIENEKGSLEIIFCDPDSIAEWIRTNLPIKIE
jgi:hypothetical protein